MATQGKGIDLFNLFQGVIGQLQNKKDELNKADQYNHDHGDNMVDTFQMIMQALQEKQGASPADQLAYASQILREKQSGSSQLYANGLSQAAQQFKGQEQVTSNNAMTLIQTLLGGGQAPVKQQQQQAGALGGILGSLFGSGKAAWDSPASGSKTASDKPASGGKAAWDKPAFGGKAAWDQPAFGGKAAWDQKPEVAPTAQSSIDALLAGLPPGWKGTLDPNTGDIKMETPYGFEPVSPKNLRDYVTWAQKDAAANAKTQQVPAQQQTNSVDYISSNTEGTAQQQGQQAGEGFDLGSLLNAGMSFMNNKSQGGSNLESIVKAVVSNSASNSGYRQESGSIVARALMQAVQGLLK